MWAVHETEACRLTEINFTEAISQSCALSTIFADLKRGLVGSRKN